MKIISAAACAFLALAPGLSQAQEVSASHRAAAEKLINLIAPREMFINAFVGGIEPLFNQLRQGGIDDAKIEQVRKASLALANKVADDPEMTERLAVVYMEEFTEEEINGIIDFYETPAGAKALKKLPQLMQKGALIGKEVTEKHQGTFQAKIQEILGEGAGN